MPAIFPQSTSFVPVLSSFLGAIAKEVRNAGVSGMFVFATWVDFITCLGVGGFTWNPSHSWRMIRIAKAHLIKTFVMVEDIKYCCEAAEC